LARRAVAASQLLAQRRSHIRVRLESSVYHGVHDDRRARAIEHGPAILLLLCIQAVDIAVYIWALVGTWRAAGNYQGPRFWAILARIGMSLGVGGSIVHLTENLSLIAGISDMAR